jgi:RNA polymerase sigma factor (sigma-70 family)
MQAPGVTPSTQVSDRPSSKIPCNRIVLSDVGSGVDPGMSEVPLLSDGSALDSLYRSEGPGLVRLARLLTGSPESAEDAVQEAFSRLQPRLGQVENPGGYLRTTVVNLCRDTLRGRQRADQLESRRFERIHITSEANEMIDVLLRLPYRQRAVLVMRFWADWSEFEIADALGCRPGTVKTLASRGLARLRKEMAL